MDAKRLLSLSIAVRCAAPPSRRKVPIQFDGWVIVAEGTEQDNVFRQCQLICDRWGSSNKQDEPTNSSALIDISHACLWCNVVSTTCEQPIPQDSCQGQESRPFVSDGCQRLTSTTLDAMLCYAVSAMLCYTTLR